MWRTGADREYSSYTDCGRDHRGEHSSYSDCGRSQIVNIPVTQIVEEITEVNIPVPQNVEEIAEVNKSSSEWRSIPLYFEEFKVFLG